MSWLRKLTGKPTKQSDCCKIEINEVKKEAKESKEVEKSKEASCCNK
ncbi:hypothetical protein LCY76_18810 [Fictibacillus sp. KIGAM418]|uniref:Uncharacterized protein n=1 Tax=Fictibacillus marinisediminis TaxID=2878389 RepID=A0A9X2BIH1_9BACL|nr:hypothetical protein [Fictibacillus marinisediminis]MCK6258628.1 hypothetical protein [Fictibacillus marinisediminis]